MPATLISFFFFFNDTATTEIYTLSLHDALPISQLWPRSRNAPQTIATNSVSSTKKSNRSEEHTSELQSRLHLVCRLLLEKKKKNTILKSTTQHTPSSRHTQRFQCVNYLRI